VRNGGAGARRPAGAVRAVAGSSPSRGSLGRGRAHIDGSIVFKAVRRPTPFLPLKR